MDSYPLDTLDAIAKALFEWFARGKDLPSRLIAISR